MNILLFQIKEGMVFPIGETIPMKKAVPEQALGQWAKIKARAYRIYWKLTKKFDYHENLCARVGTVTTLDIYHPYNMGSDSARKEFRKFLKTQYRKHSRWMWTTSILAFFGAFLTPIPGPNIFFFYPAARTLGHYLAKKGARQLLAIPDVSFRKDPLIDQVWENFENPQELLQLLIIIGKRYNIKDLKNTVDRLRNS